MTSLQYLNGQKEIDPDKKRGAILGYAKYKLRQLEAKEKEKKAVQ